MDISALRTRSEVFSQYFTPIPGEKRHIRRSLSSKLIPIDYFELYDVKDGVIQGIFDYLPVTDLVNAMSVCKRFHRIGKISKTWESFDRQHLRIGQFALHRILERQTKKMRLANATIFVEYLSYPILIQQLFNNLTYLDLSYATYSDPNILNSILDRTAYLKVLNIAQFSPVSEALCHKIARNSGLRFLNMEMCEEFSLNGIMTILRSCKKLLELNLAWAKFENGALKVACKNLPSSMIRFNMSGMQREVTDEDIKSIVARCPQMMELDLSDCTAITGDSIKTFNKLANIQKIFIARCYGIEPMSLLDFKGLDELNVHGCVVEDGVKVLRSELYPTAINESTHCDIARPSFSQFNIEL